MNMFKNLLGRQEISEDERLAQQQFDSEWQAALVRFGVVTGVGEITVNLEHPETHQPMLPHQGLNGTFSEWKQVPVFYERRTLLFHLIYDMVGKSMKRYQVAQYLLATRMPDKALMLMEQELPDEAPVLRFQTLAKAYVNLVRPLEALPWAEQAAALDSGNTASQVVLADALHMTGECERAHGIYSRLMTSAAAIGDGSACTILEMFQSLFSVETGAVPSPVFAIEIAESLSDPIQSEDFWQLAEAEFYDSPYFRMQHAYYLAKVGQIHRSFAKLAALVQEMPQLREPSLNLLGLFAHLDPAGNQIMPEFQTQLRRTIEENGWTTEGMHRV